MNKGDILILRGAEVQALLDGREPEIIDAVRAAYVAHARGESSLPHSTFLTYPDGSRNRIIALPAYLGGDFRASGVKWVSSFPGNLSLGMDRASAVVVVNSSETGRPEAFIEGSLISAKRTAASAALAAQLLSDCDADAAVTMVGCGLINFEIARFLSVTCPRVKQFKLFDLDPARAEYFGRKLESTFGGVRAEVIGDLKAALGAAPLISLATTTVKPHIEDLSACAPRATVLHISLRDLSPEAILAADNVVDDVNHVSRAQTSIHLAEMQTGNRDFVRCTLADIVEGTAPARRDDESIAVFSPFGLGVLDLAVSKLVLGLGSQQGLGTVIESFLPAPWNSSEPQS